MTLGKLKLMWKLAMNGNPLLGLCNFVDWNKGGSFYFFGFSHYFLDMACIISALCQIVKQNCDSEWYNPNPILR